MVTQGSISFPRSCKPEDIDLLQAAILIVFMDGSDVTKAFVAYIRYILMSGLAHVSLLSSKAKLNTAGTPRSELDGHTLGARGTRNITTARGGSCSFFGVVRKPHRGDL
jgi:hypothetical protein